MAPTTPLRRAHRRAARAALAAALLAWPAAAEPADPAEPPRESYSPHVDPAGATRVFWGDTHVHSSWSPDAFTLGNRRLGPGDAFRFAAGEEVTAHNGMRVRLRRPVDFLLVSDHSEYLGLFPKRAFTNSAKTGAGFSERICSAVWARENTRAEIFDAMRRRETYATTGPRMLVRFFGGWGFAPTDAVAPDPARVGYAQGVPMGGELGPAPGGRAPSFLVAALRDPEGANLDRVQVIKSWRAADGTLREKIHDVAVSGGRPVGPDGRAREPVGSSVNLATATYTNTLGAGELAAVWRDPDFDLALHAVYYVRVLEIPTPHWSAVDAAFFGTERPEGAPATIQERAYTSPIWYVPPAGG